MSEMEDAGEDLSIDEWTGADDKFALRVEGNSMIEEHITDGDFVVIKKQTQAHDGQIVAVRDEDDTFTLRKFYRAANGSIRLESGGGRSSVARPADFPILGVLVGVVRKY